MALIRKRSKVFRIPEMACKLLDDQSVELIWMFTTKINWHRRNARIRFALLCSLLNIEMQEFALHSYVRCWTEECKDSHFIPMPIVKYSFPSWLFKFKIENTFLTVIVHKCNHNSTLLHIRSFIDRNYNKLNKQKNIYIFYKY